MQSITPTRRGSAGRFTLAMVFIVAGAMHFIIPQNYLRIMPPFIPMHYEIVAVSGVVEGALGLLLLVPRTQRVAAWGLIVTLIAIFPANIYGAVTAGTPNPAMPGVSVELAYWYTR